ncbi:MAG: sugar transferase [Lachnospiraceae bacterium]|nr:sugar transferase [Lachnospiraceae bacterium]
MYKNCLKRCFDFSLALVALIILSPFLLILWIIVRIKMGHPAVFTQLRPGYKEKIFKIYKFRTMTNEKDENGDLLPDDKRLTSFGLFLRRTSLDELPQLLNIIKGDLAIIGPRPLLVQYLPLYNENQRKRHDVRPGFTGYAQVNGRNAVTWPEKFAMDTWYSENVSFILDMRIFFKTIKTVIKSDGISSATAATMEYFTGEE